MQSTKDITRITISYDDQGPKQKGWCYSVWVTEAYYVQDPYEIDGEGETWVEQEDWDHSDTLPVLRIDAGLTTLRRAVANILGKNFPKEARKDYAWDEKHDGGRYYEWRG